MEQYLENLGYNIRTDDEENVIDSSLVCEYEVDLWYSPIMIDETFEIMIYLDE